MGHDDMTAGAMNGDQGQINRDGTFWDCVCTGGGCDVKG